MWRKVAPPRSGARYLVGQSVSDTGRPGQK